MYNNIKSKTLGVHKRKMLLVLLLVISMFTIVACDSKKNQVTIQEFELVSCYIEYRHQTNGFGGIIRTDEYLHYGYVDNYGQVTFDETYFDYADFQVTEGTPKVIITTSNSHGTSYIFQLTREMYKNINSSQK